MSLGKDVARSAGWMLAIRMSARVIGLASTLILARLLVPADFGLIAMGTSILAALEAATAFGIMPFETWMAADTWGAYRAFADFAIGALVAVLVRESRWQLSSTLPAWLLLVLAIIGAIILQQTRLGRYICAVGSNERVRAPRLPLSGERRQAAEKVVKDAMATRPEIPAF